MFSVRQVQAVSMPSDLKRGYGKRAKGLPRTTGGRDRHYVDKTVSTDDQRREGRAIGPARTLKT
jgi:hypothetical protein